MRGWKKRSAKKRTGKEDGNKTGAKTKGRGKRSKCIEIIIRGGRRTGVLILGRNLETEENKI